jgi:predicted RNase H-like nuclease (RuvC/YqgF family)
MSALGDYIRKLEEENEELKKQRNEYRDGMFDLRSKLTQLNAKYQYLLIQQSSKD